MTKHLTHLTALLVGALIGVLPIGLARSAAAAPALHDVFVEDFDATEHFAAGEAEPCVTWAGSFHEARSGEGKLVVISSGPQAGEVHANGVVDGSVEFVPDDPRLPTYSGTYREKLNAVIADFASDETKVSQFRLRSRLTGTDGSSLSLVLSGKVTVNGNGSLVVERDRYTCE